MSLARPLRSALVGAGVLALGAAAPASAAVRVTTDRALQPAFSATTPDYASRCPADGPLLVTVHASGGDRVSIAGRAERGGNFTEKVSRRPGKRFSILVHPSGGFAQAHQVRCLPPDFPRFAFRRSGTPQAQWYLVTPVTPPTSRYAAIFDSHGAPVWWWRSPTIHYMPWDAKLLDDGLLAIGRNRYSPFGVHDDSGYDELTLSGRVVSTVETGGSPTDVHDLQRLPNGDFLGITYRKRENVDLSRWGGSAHARVFDGEIQELSPAGKVVWRWNSKDHFSPGETARAYWYNPTAGNLPPPNVRGYDMLHINSVQPDGDGIVVSARHLDAVFRIDRATGDVDWKLGGTFVLGESLTVLGTPLGSHPLGGQHDARVLGDGTLTVYDNRTDVGEPPAAERFRIDPTARTATRIEHVTEPNVPRSKWGGSARKLPSGDWVVCWAGAPLVTEQTPAGRVLVALRFTGDERSYRAQPLLPGQLSASGLRRAMDELVAAGG